ncbi:hypothetical protein L1987_57966 [Smallanthus sonchifolius]|uniref:Uncharacterized protein n=1 Tax=Smallanthus sonchifolius TaxID=185202 RepID=A0ACB9DEC2_9ASTR|nr:hypothetical protein L1987_57966 [Smallanthus sonchifolius]
MVDAVNPKEAEDVFVLEWSILNKDLIATSDLGGAYMYNVTIPTEFVHFRNLSHTDLMEVALVSQTRSNAWVAELHHHLSEVFEENKKSSGSGYACGSRGKEAAEKAAVESARDEALSLTKQLEAMLQHVSKEKVSEVENLKKHVEQKTPIREIPYQPIEPEAAIDAKVVAFESIQVSVVSELSGMVSATFTEVQAFLRIDDKV